MATLKIDKSYIDEVIQDAVDDIKRNFLEQIYSDLLRVKHNTMSIDELIDKVYEAKREKNKDKSYYQLTKEAADRL